MAKTKLQIYGASTEDLTDKQRRFVAEYRQDYNAAEAAIRAGYGVKSARQMGQKLLKNPTIARAIGKQEKQLLERVELNTEEIIRQLYYLATRDAADFVDEDGIVKNVNDMTPRARAVIDGFEQEVLVTRDDDGEETRRIIKTKIKISPKAVGVEMAMKHKGLFAPEEHKHEHSIVPPWDVVAEGITPMVMPEDIIETKLLENPDAAAKSDSPQTD